MTGMTIMTDVSRLRSLDATAVQQVCDGVGGALGAALGREARAGGGKPRARRGRDGAGERGGELGAKGVARVVFDRLPAKRQPLRAG